MWRYFHSLEYRVSAAFLEHAHSCHPSPMKEKKTIHLCLELQRPLICPWSVLRLLLCCKKLCSTKTHTTLLLYVFEASRMILSGFNYLEVWRMNRICMDDGVSLSGAHRTVVPSWPSLPCLFSFKSKRPLIWLLNLRLMLSQQGNAAGGESERERDTSQKKENEI